MIHYIGIDLGQKGSLTIISQNVFKKTTTQIFSFWGRFEGTKLRTMTELEYLELLQGIQKYGGEFFVAIEHPVFMPVSGKKSTASMFNNFGLMRGLILGLDFTDNIYCPTPREWKALVKAKGSDKNVMAKLASKRFPKLKGITAETADSVLIAEACRQYYH